MAVDLKLTRPGRSNITLLSAGTTRPYKIWSVNFSPHTARPTVRNDGINFWDKLRTAPPVSSRAKVWAELLLDYGRPAPHPSFPDASLTVNVSVNFVYSAVYGGRFNGDSKVVFQDNRWLNLETFTDVSYGTDGYFAGSTGGHAPGTLYIGYWG